MEGDPCLERIPFHPSQRRTEERLAEDLETWGLFVLSKELILHGGVYV